MSDIRWAHYSVASFSVLFPVCEQLKHFNNPGDAWVTRGLISYSVLVGSAIFSSQLVCLSLDSKLQGRTMDQKE